MLVFVFSRMFANVGVEWSFLFQLINNPALQQILIKLVASKEEAEVAKVIAKATKGPVPVNQGPFVGRTWRAPYSRRGNWSSRPPLDRKCWVCGNLDHISRTYPERHKT